jgi:hypothetical protein
MPRLEDCLDQRDRPTDGRFARWIIAAEPAVPWKPDAFLQAYQQNRAGAVEALRDGDVVADAVRAIVREHGAWCGTATDLLNELQHHGVQLFDPRQATGALATLPDTFKTCYRAASIPSVDLRDCYLFGGSFPGVKDVACGNCIGNRFCIGARQAHAEQTGEHIPIRMFYKSHISGNDFTALVRVNSWADSMGL